MKKLITSLVIIPLVMLFTSMTVFGATDISNWTEHATNPDLTTEKTITDGEEYEVHYSLSMPPPVGEIIKGFPVDWDTIPQPADGVPIGLPNVYLVDKDNGERIQHQFGYTQDHRTTTTFLLGLKNSEGKYEVFESPYTDSKIYTRANTNPSLGDIILGKNVKPIDGYGEIVFETRLTPLTANTVEHRFSVTNTGNDDLTFIPFKYVDTELDNYDDVPVYMLGHNTGAYIESGRYRLNYIFDHPLGPNYFSNYYEKYNTPTSDIYDHKIPFKAWDPATIHGLGQEAEGYEPDAILPHRGKKNDTGIAMKWDEVTLKPGESMDFKYDVSLSGTLGTEYYYKNMTQSSTKNYTGDHLYLLASGTWDPDDYKPVSGKISTVVDPDLEIDPNSNIHVTVRDVNSPDPEAEEILRTLPMKDYWNPTTRTISVDITEDDLNHPLIDWIGIGFDADITHDAAGKELKNTSSVTMKNLLSGIIITKEDFVSIFVEDMPDVSILKSANNPKGDELHFSENDTINYSISAQSNDDNILTKAVVEDVMPKDFKKPTNVKLNGKPILEKTSNNQLAPNYSFDTSDLASNKLTVELGNIEEHETKLITYDISAPKSDDTMHLAPRINKAFLNGSNLAEPVYSEVTVFLNNLHVVEFDSTGGSAVNDVVVPHGEKVSKPVNPTYKDKVFKGWFSDPKLENEYNFNSPVLRDMTLFAKWESPIVDPNDGVTPIDPEDPVENPKNPITDGLRIQYVSDFDFGQHVRPYAGEQTYYANPDKVVTDNQPTTKEVAPFISIIDDRGLEDMSTWSLEAKTSVFKKGNNSVLEDADLILSDLKYDTPTNLGTPPSITSNQVTLGGSPQMISQFDRLDNNTTWSLKFGELNNNHEAEGVQLRLPVTQVPELGTYQAVIDWELKTKVTR